MKCEKDIKVLKDLSINQILSDLEDIVKDNTIYTSKSNEISENTYSCSKRKIDNKKKIYCVEIPKEIILNPPPKFDFPQTLGEENRIKFLNRLPEIEEEENKNISELKELSKQYSNTKEEINRLNEKLAEIAYKLSECKKREEKIKTQEKILDEPNKIKNTILDICRNLDYLYCDDVIIFDEDKNILSYKLTIATPEDPGLIKLGQFLDLRAFINNHRIPICVIFVDENNVNKAEIKSGKYSVRKEKSTELILTREADGRNILDVPRSINSSSTLREKVDTLMGHIILEEGKSLLLLI